MSWLLEALAAGSFVSFGAEQAAKSFIESYCLIQRLLHTHTLMSNKAVKNIEEWKMISFQGRAMYGQAYEPLLLLTGSC